MKEIKSQKHLLLINKAGKICFQETVTYNQPDAFNFVYNKSIC